MDGAGRSHGPGRAGTGPGTATLRRPAGPSHARHGWLRSRGGSASRAQHENHPGGDPDVQVNDSAGQAAAEGAHHVCGAQDRVRLVGPRGTPSLGKLQAPVVGFGMTHVILVVEDNDRNLKLLRDVFEYAGYDVRAARTAEEGITMAVNQPPN